MHLIRTSVVTLVAVAVLAMAVPVQARGLEKPQPSVQSQGGGWLDLAVTWLTRLTGNEPTTGSRTMKSTTPPPPTSNGGPHYTPLGGPCIDPMGVGRCGV
jgi:hypothetical protein